MKNDNQYIACVDLFEKTKEFSYLAEQYNKTGMYTSAIPGTMEYLDFWQEVRDVCLEGFTNSVDQTITGQHFFYLNFCPILGLNEKTGKKSKIFPRFIDLDYEFFHMVEYCRLNQKSLVAVKGRRQGWSYKAAAICTHEFYFYPDSKAVIGAFFSSFSQNTMNMVVDNSNFINTNTEFRKQRNPDLKDFIKARYQATVSGVKVWKGFNSEVRAISFKDNPTAAVGLSASWLILDEAGVFNNITDTYGYTEPLIKDGSTYTGVALIFGSSGDMDSGSKYFYEMFTNPEKYNMLDFEDPFNPNGRIGFFSSIICLKYSIARLLLGELTTLQFSSPTTYFKASILDLGYEYPNLIFLLNSALNSGDCDAKIPATFLNSSILPFSLPKDIVLTQPSFSRIEIPPFEK